MKRTTITILCIFLTLVGTMSAFALDVTGTAPVFSGSGLYGAIATELNKEVANAFDNALSEIQAQVGDIDSKPEKFIQAWGNSGVYASHGASQRAYFGYKTFAVTLGAMVGFQLPSSPFSIIDDLEGIADKLNDEHDLALGINPQILNAHIGLNTSEFLLENLYLGVRLGYMKLDNLIEGFSFDNMLVGVTADYQLLPSVSLAGGLLQWRGLNVGTGVIYQGTSIGYNVGLDSFSEALSVTGLGSMDLQLKPEVGLDMTINTITIPLEATTSVKLLHFLNFSLGLGADLGFGTSDLKVGMGGDIFVTGLEGTGIQQDEAGSLSVSAGGSMSPSIFNLKLMTGIGFTLGPVVIDIPLSYYFLDNGFNLGVTIGVVW